MPLLTLEATAGGTTNPIPAIYTLDAGASMTIRAIPDTGYIFREWLVQGQPFRKDNPITATMPSYDITLTAVFGLPILAIATTGGGTTTPAPGSYEHNVGDVVVLTAYPDEGWWFANWEVNGEVRTDNPLVLYIYANDVIVNAIFTSTAPTYPLTLQASPAEGGTTEPPPGVYEHEAGEMVTVVAIPNAEAGYYFDHWQIGTLVRTDNPLTATMVAHPVTVVAVFSTTAPPTPPLTDVTAIAAPILVGSALVLAGAK